MKRIVAIVLVVALTAVLFVGCDMRSDEEKIRDRMHSFAKAYNTGDFEGVLDCFDARTRNMYKAAFNLGGNLVGGLFGFDVDMADLFGLGAGLMPEDEKMNIEQIEVSILSDTTALAECTFVYHDYDETYRSEMTFSLVKEDNDWFITE